MAIPRFFQSLSYMKLESIIADFQLKGQPLYFLVGHIFFWSFDY
jgi:hypothetical protein